MLKWLLAEKISKTADKIRFLVRKKTHFINGVKSSGCSISLGVGGGGGSSVSVPSSSWSRYEPGVVGGRSRATSPCSPSTLSPSSLPSSSSLSLIVWVERYFSLDCMALAARPGSASSQAFFRARISSALSVSFFTSISSCRKSDQ